MRGNGVAKVQRRRGQSGGEAGGELVQPTDNHSIPQDVVVVNTHDAALSERPPLSILCPMLTLAVRRGDYAIFRELAALALRWQARGAFVV